MTNNNAILGLWAETSLHPGAGGSIEGVDLPIQREGHSGWPCVFGSAMKGALRSKAEDKLGKDNLSIAYVFGPDSSSDNASEHAGALLVGDARLLLLPVRSLTSHFKWVTCPALLSRLQRDAKRLDIALDFPIPKPSAKLVSLSAKVEATNLFLEEYRLSTEQTDMAALINILHKLSSIEQEQLVEQLVIVHDDMFSYLSRYATPVAAHIAIDNERKTVKKGALWYEETLPPETVFYSALSAQKGRVKDNEIAAEAILQSITQDIFGPSPYLQVGGNETVGMGWCKVTVFNGN